MNRIDDRAMPPQQRNQIIGGKKDGGDVLIWMDTNLFAEKARIQIDMDPMVRVIQHAKGVTPPRCSPRIARRSLSDAKLSRREPMVC